MSDAITLYDATGQRIDVLDGVAIPASTYGHLRQGKDENSASRTTLVESKASARLSVSTPVYGDRFSPLSNKATDYTTASVFTQFTPGGFTTFDPPASSNTGYVTHRPLSTIKVAVFQADGSPTPADTGNTYIRYIGSDGNRYNMTIPASTTYEPSIDGPGFGGYFVATGTASPTIIVIEQVFNDSIVGANPEVYSPNFDQSGSTQDLDIGLTTSASVPVWTWRNPYVMCPQGKVLLFYGINVVQTNTGISNAGLHIYSLDFDYVNWVPPATVGGARTDFWYNAYYLDHVRIANQSTAQALYDPPICIASPPNMITALGLFQDSGASILYATPRYIEISQ